MLLLLCTCSVLAPLPYRPFFFPPPPDADREADKRRGATSACFSDGYDIVHELVEGFVCIFRTRRGIVFENKSVPDHGVAGEYLTTKVHDQDEGGANDDDVKDDDDTLLLLSQLIAS